MHPGHRTQTEFPRDQFSRISREGEKIDLITDKAEYPSRVQFGGHGVPVRARCQGYRRRNEFNARRKQDRDLKTDSGVRIDDIDPHRERIAWISADR